MKTIQTLCLTILLALSLTACAGKPTVPPAETTTTGSSDTTASTETETTVETTATTTGDTTIQESQRSTAGGNTTSSAGAPASRSIDKTTTTTKQSNTTTVTTTAKKTTTTKTTTTAKKPTTTTKKPTATTTGNTVAVAQYESEVLRLVNAERAAQGLAALSAGSSAAMQAADVRATEILQSFSHTRPNGSSCFTALDEAGVSYRTAGENIALGYRTPATVVEGWMNSDGHRANILNKTFTHMAVGYHNNGWVQLFYTPVA